MLRGTRSPQDQSTPPEDLSKRIAWLTGVPVPPSINEAYINRRGFSGPGRVKSARYRVFEMEMFDWKLKHSAEVENAVAVIEHGVWVQMDVSFCFPRSRVITKAGGPKRHDLDNRLKVLNDAVAEALGFNDCRIAGQRLEKCVTDDDKAYVIVAISARPGLFPPPL